MNERKGEAPGLAFLLWLETAAAVLWCGVVALALRDRQLGRSLVTPRHTPPSAALLHGSITMIVPARNEAENIEAWIGRATAQGDVVARIIVADDGSEDATAEIAELHARHDPRIEVLRCPPPPAGWVGKNWAASMAAARARTE